MKLVLIVKHTIENALRVFYDGNDAESFILNVAKNHKISDIPSNVNSVFDKSSNILMLCRNVPHKINTTKLIEHLEQQSHIFDKLEIKNNFINFRLNTQFILRNIVRRQDEKIDKDKDKINLEFVSANPTGPMHIGHIRGAIYGQAISNLLCYSGYNVTNEYYINDGGEQIKKLMIAVFAEYVNIIKQRNDAVNYKDFFYSSSSLIEKYSEQLYSGDYIVTMATHIATKSKNYLSFEEFFDCYKNYVIEYNLNMIKSDLQKIGVSHNVFSSEVEIVNKSLINNDLVNFIKNSTESDLKYNDSDLIIEEYLEKPKGVAGNDWQQRKQLLFNSTLFGDDNNRALTKEDGSYTYFANDIVYNLDKVNRGFSNLIIILGADHKGYVIRLKSIIENLYNKESKVKMNIILSEMVNFVRNGENVKMSKRKGTIVSLDDVISEISSHGITQEDAIDVLKFFLLSKKPDTVTNFDFYELTRQSSDNPVFYVHYAYARSCSVIRHIITPILKNNFKNKDIDHQFVDNFLLSEVKDNESDRMYVNEAVQKIFNYLTDSSLSLSFMQRKILLKILEYNTILDMACQKYQPHLLINYAIELASLLHKAWNGSEENEIKFISCDISKLSNVNLSNLNSCDSSVKQTLLNFLLLYFVNHRLKMVFNILDIKSKLTM